MQTTMDFGVSLLGSTHFESGQVRHNATYFPVAAELGIAQTGSNVTITPDGGRTSQRRSSGSQLALALVDGDLASTGRFVLP